MKCIDLTNQRFGKWTALERDYSKGSKNAYWICMCDCGTIKSVASQKLRNGLSISCGCDDTRKKAAIAKQTHDLSGQLFDYWKVIKRDYSKTGRTYWHCECRCGSSKSVLGSSLIRGLSKSCGCKPAEWKEKSVPPKKQLKTFEEIQLDVETCSSKHTLLDIKREDGVIKIYVQCCYGHVPYWTALGTFKRSTTDAHGCKECLLEETKRKNAKYTMDEVRRLLSLHDMEFVVEPDPAMELFTGVIEYRCKKCGHVSNVRPIHLINGRGCRNCLGLLKRTPEEYCLLIAETEPEYEVLSDYDGVAKPVLMRHKVCGTEYYVTPNNFNSGKRCPNCRFSRGEKCVETFLSLHNIQFISQYKFPDCVYKKSLRFDFFLPQYNMCIEFQGKQHFENVPSWGGESAFQERLQRDQIKREYCKNKGIDLLEISYEDIEQVDAVLLREIGSFESRSITETAGAAG